MSVFRTALPVAAVAAACLALGALPSASGASVSITSCPTTALAGTTITVKWSVSGGTPTSHNHVHWGTDPAVLATLTAHDVSAPYQASFKAPALGPVYLKVHCQVGSANVFSSLRKINITPQPGHRLSNVTPPAWTSRDPIGGTMSVQVWNGPDTAAVLKVVVGIRRSDGRWTGGAPQVILTDTPPPGPPGTTFDNVAFAGLAVPGAGSYKVWTYLAEAASDTDAVQAFKDRSPTSQTDRHRIVGTLTVVALVPGLRLSDQSPESWTGGNVHPEITGAMTVQMWNGEDAGKVCKVVVGIRDAAGKWAGGTPQVIKTDTPPAGPPGRTFANRSFQDLAVPATSGDFTVWAYLAQATTDAEAIQAFKDRSPTAETERHRIVGPLTVRQPGMRLSNRSPSSWMTRDPIGGSMSVQMWNGESAGATLRAVVGIRDAAGAWVGGAPRVIKSAAPPVGPPGATYANCSFTDLAVPAAIGEYKVWAYLAQVASDAEAIQAFKDRFPTAETDRHRIVGPLSVPKFMPIPLAGNPPGGMVLGRIAVTGEVDLFSLDVPAGQGGHWVLWVNINLGTGSLGDSLLTLYLDSALTQQLATNDECRVSGCLYNHTLHHSRIDAALAGGQRYYLKVGAFGINRGTYAVGAARE